MPLLYRSLDEVGADRVPREPFLQLWQDYEKNAQRNEQLVAELLRVLTFLERAGVRAIPYKGPALGYLLSGHARFRDFEDLDLLVRHRDMRTAIAALEPHGYDPDVPLTPLGEEALLQSRAQYHRVMLKRDSGIKIELHWKTDVDFPVEQDTDEWWSRVGHAAIAGQHVLSLRRDELLLVLCLHGTKHQGYRIGWIVDIAEMLRHDGGVDWPWLVGTAADLGCRRRLGVSLLLARELLEAPVPEPVSREMCEPPVVKALVREIVDQIANADPQEPASMPRLALSLRLYDRRRDQIAHAAMVGFSPTIREWSRWPLPRVLYPLYVPLRLARLAGKYGARVMGRN